MLDFYSKAMLTIIAAALCMILAQMSFGAANAQDRFCGITMETACFVTTNGDISEKYNQRHTSVQIETLR